MREGGNRLLSFLSLLMNKQFRTLNKAVVEAATNYLIIRISNCTQLIPPNGISPAAFVALSAYGDQNVITDTVRNTTRPKFNYIKSLPLPITHDVDRYLRTTNV